MSDRECQMTNQHSINNGDREPSSRAEHPLTLDDMLEAVRLLKRPMLCRIEIGEDMLGFISDMICRVNPKPLLDDTVFGGVPIVDSECLPPGWARGVDQEGDTLFLMTREHFYDFSKVSILKYFGTPTLPAIKLPPERPLFWNNWWLRFP